MKKRYIPSILIALCLLIAACVGVVYAKYASEKKAENLFLLSSDVKFETYTYAIFDEDTGALSIRSREAVIKDGMLIEREGSYELGDNGVVYALPYQQSTSDIWKESDVRIATGKVPEGAIGENDNSAWQTAHNSKGSLEDAVISVTFEDTVYLQGNLAQLFQQWSNLKSVDLNNAIFTDVTSTRKLFDTCANLTDIQFSPTIDTSNVTNMSGMFYSLTSLETVDVSHFNTSKVTTMWEMFRYSSKIKSLNLRGWDTSLVTNMGHMFSQCSGLEELDVSNFNTSNVTNMEHMFNYCTKLTTLDVSKFDTSKVTFMISMFQMCQKIEYLDLRNFNTSGISNMTALFNGCNSLKTLLWDMEKFDTSNVSGFSSMFKDCSSLTELDLSHFDTKKATSMESMFEGCSKLTDGTLNIISFNTAKVASMKKMFQHCSALGDLDLSHFDTSSLTNAQEMFNQSGVTTLDLSSFDTDQTTNLSQMFQSCSKLTTIYVSDKFVVSEGCNTSNMFANARSLVGGNRTSYDTAQVKDGTYAHIDGMNGQRGYFTAKGVTVSPANINITVDPTVADSFSTSYIFLGEPITVTLTGVKEGVAEVTLTSTIGETSATATATVTNGTITIPADLVTDGAVITISAASATPETPSEDTTGNEENNTTEPEATGGTENTSNEQESPVSEETTSPENVATDPVLPPSEGSEDAENGTEQTEGQQDQE